MAPHSSTLAWKIPWVEEPGGLQSMGSLRVGHDWATLLSLFTFMHWRRKWQPTPVFLPGESQGRGAWGAAVYGIAQSRTRLKRLSSSSSSSIDLLSILLRCNGFTGTQRAVVDQIGSRPSNSDHDLFLVQFGFRKCFWAPSQSNHWAS